MNALERLWNLHHRALLMLSGASSSRLDAEPRKLKHSSTSPSGTAIIDLRKLERRWETSESDGARWSVLRDAKALVDAHTTPNADPRALRGTKEWREIVANDPRSSRVVAKIYGVGKNTVLRYRAEFKRFGSDGP